MRKKKLSSFTEICSGFSATAYNKRYRCPGYRGWWCSRVAEHSGPCALRPRWWNLVGHLFG